METFLRRKVLSSVRGGYGTRGFPSRVGTSAALAITLAFLLWLPDETQAACVPASPVNDADVTCTDTTADQNAPNGYGTGLDTGNIITVVPGATVTGTDNGIIFNSGTVINSGTISGGLSGISGTTANVTNSGSIATTDPVTGIGIFVLDTVTVTNSGTISGSGTFGEGIRAANNVTVTNSGTITAPARAIISPGGTAAVSNSGTIAGGFNGIRAATVIVTNTGAISGGDEAIFAGTAAKVVNAGTITGTGPASFGIVSNDTATVTNFGTISGIIGIAVFGHGEVTNAGAIIGSGGTAIQFVGTADTLTLLPGSTIIGAINLGGGGDTVNVLAGNQNLTFDNLAGATITSNVPFAVSGNQVATIDPTPFAMADRNLMDFSRAVSSVVPDIEGSLTAITAEAAGGSSLAFAGPDADASTIADDIAAARGLSAYANDSTLPFKSPTVVYRDGTAIWARGFVGERVQNAEGPLLETHNRFYGGLLGGGWQVRPNLRLSLFAGAGETRSQVDPGFGETKSTLVFAGLYGRSTWGASFLRFGLQGGHTSNDSSRNINNNLVAGGIENATASFDGWYINPEATFGHHFALGLVAGAAYTLTPSLTVRYLHAGFDGYTETGTTAPLTVGDRTADNFEERGQLKLTRTQIFAPTEMLKASLFGGLLADQRLGDDTVDAALLGQAIPFAVLGDDSVWGGFGGAGFEWHSGQVTLFASAEYLALSDSSSVVSGQGGVRIAF
jgi:hypothetical protein